MRAHIDIPDAVYRSLRIPRGEIEAELRKELAVALYQRAALGFGKARELAGLSRWELHELLGKRGVVRHYSAEDFEEDVRHGRSGQ